jgi:hypothetical protein
MPFQVSYGDILREQGIEAFQSPADHEIPTFIKFTFLSSLEAKNRAAAVALLTAKYLQGSTNFIHMFTAEMLADDPTTCLTRIKQIGGQIISKPKPGEEFIANIEDLH